MQKLDLLLIMVSARLVYYCPSHGHMLIDCIAATGPSASVADAETIARNVAALRHRQKGKKSKGRANDSDRGSEYVFAFHLHVTGELKRSRSSDTASIHVPKQQRKWGRTALTAQDMATYDYSGPTSLASTPTGGSSLINAGAMGKRDRGMYQVADIDEVDNEAEDAAKSKTSWTSFFSGFTSQAVTSKELDPALRAMTTQLMDKNVASDIAGKIVEAVGRDLAGRKVGWGGKLPLLYIGGQGLTALPQALTLFSEALQRPA